MHVFFFLELVHRTESFSCSFITVNIKNTGEVRLKIKHSPEQCKMQEAVHENSVSDAGNL